MKARYLVTGKRSKFQGVYETVGARALVLVAAPFAVSGSASTRAHSNCWSKSSGCKPNNSLNVHLGWSHQKLRTGFTTEVTPRMAPRVFASTFFNALSTHLAMEKTRILRAFKCLKRSS
jgi:hypothetical protein